MPPSKSGSLARYNIAAKSKVDVATFYGRKITKRVLYTYRTNCTVKGSPKRPPTAAHGRTILPSGTLDPPSRPASLSHVRKSIAGKIVAKSNLLENSAKFTRKSRFVKSR